MQYVRRNSDTTEAVQWTGKNNEEVTELCGSKARWDADKILYVGGINGSRIVNVSDYIIRLGDVSFSIYYEARFDLMYKEVGSDD